MNASGNGRAAGFSFASDDPAPAPTVLPCPSCGEALTLLPVGRWICASCGYGLQASAPRARALPEPQRPAPPAEDISALWPKISTRVPDELWEAVKIAGVRRRLTMTAIVLEALRLWLASIGEPGGA